MGIRFCDFDMNMPIVAPVIYDSTPHLTTNKGVVISSEIKQELGKFLSSFNASANVEQVPYYRIDAYFDEKSLWILEINASFVDGWGTALNLARASDIPVDPKELIFPQRFAIQDSVYLPELKLFLDEMSALGIKNHTVCEWNEGGSNQIYVYGRVGSKDQPHILPYDGLRIDNKLNLCLFSRTWNSTLVKIPRHYVHRFDPWEEIPGEVVLKFCEKGSAECEKARQSVIFNKPSGQAKFIRQCYSAETLIVQDIVHPTKQGENNCQLIIFVIGDKPITGYVQYSEKNIINDNSIHGPLRIS